IDTNVVLDFLLEREPFVESAAKLFQQIDHGQIEGFITATTITNIYYILRKAAGSTIAILLARNHSTVHISLASSQGKPIKPETSKQENNSAFTTNLNSQESTQAKDSSPATNSEGSTEGQDDSKTAAGNIPSELEQPLAISCEENCQPEYPSVLDGAEGSTGIELTIDRDGNVIDAAIALKNGNPQLDREALKAAQEMEFSSIKRDRATVRINISFTVAGSDFER
ncbi:MAG: hypothetical protein RLZZ381_571, partial [Cyanobacteriota bacterium]